MIPPGGEFPGRGEPRGGSPGGGGIAGGMYSLAYPKGFALCRQPLLEAQDQSERVELEILRILHQEMARDPDSRAQICSATFW